MAIAIATEWSLFQNCCETVEDDFRSTTMGKAEWQVRSLISYSAVVGTYQPLSS